MTIYLFSGCQQRYFRIKETHDFAKDYLLSWFPKLSFYATFNARLNLLNGAFQELTAHLISSLKPKDCSSVISIVDSFSVITYSSKNRIGKVAPEITAKGYCSSKGMYYYGCKIHAFTTQRKESIPFSESLMVTPASDNDLTVFKEAWGDKLFFKIIFGDKIYSDFEYFNSTKKDKQMIEMLTPVKAIKGQCEEIKQRDKVFNDLFS